MTVYFPLYFCFQFPPLPAKAQVNVSAKTLKQLGECDTSLQQHFKVKPSSSDISLFSSLPRLLCRFPRFRGVAAVLSSPGNLPQARRHTRHSQQKQRRGDLSHQRRRNEATFYTAISHDKPSWQERGRTLDRCRELWCHFNESRVMCNS